MSIYRLMIGIVLGPAVAYAAWRRQMLTQDGALAAALLGALVFGLGGLPWAVLLLAFFLSSSALSKSFLRHKTGLAEKFSKGGQRDWMQVAANGGSAALLVVLQTILPGQTWPWLAFAAAMAAVNADTWATELGVLSPTAPRLITGGKIVEKGTSGGITLTGTLASLAGAALIGGLAAIFPDLAGLRTVKQGVFLSAAVTLAGLLGSLLDSWLGATLQAIYYCHACGKETERHPQHSCGTLTHRIRGLAWLNNDMVNLLASLAAAVLMVAVWQGWR